jgi:hypothetical protein
MKPLTAAISIAVLALPLCAADQQQPNTTSTTLSSVAAPQQQDSPLVRAAKATGRLGKKPTMVITNETLLRSGGHFTMANTAPSQLPAAYAQPNNEQARLEAALRAKRAADEKAKIDAVEKKKQDLRRASADYYGESIEPRVDDPAMQEEQMNRMTPAQPKVQPASKPPQNQEG